MGCFGCGVTFIKKYFWTDVCLRTVGQKNNCHNLYTIVNACLQGRCRRQSLGSISSSRLRRLGKHPLSFHCGHYDWSAEVHNIRVCWDKWSADIHGLHSHVTWKNETILRHSTWISCYATSPELLQQVHTHAINFQNCIKFFHYCITWNNYRQ